MCLGGGKEFPGQVGRSLGVKFLKPGSEQGSRCRLGRAPERLNLAWVAAVWPRATAGNQHKADCLNFHLRDGGCENQRPAMPPVQKVRKDFGSVELW